MKSPVSSPPVAVVAGHICLDIIPRIDSPPEINGQLVMPGQLAQVGPATISTGGAVSNTGLALHRLGIQTRLLGKIGNDFFGRAIMEILRQRDPHLTGGMIIDEGGSTSYTVVLSAPGFDRGFLHCAGSNDTFSPSEVDLAQLAGATLFHFGYPPLMQKTFDDGGVAFAALLHQIQAMGIATSLDMAHVDIDSPAGSVDWGQFLERVLPYVDLFVPSCDEIYTMCAPEHVKGSAPAHAALAENWGIPLLRELTGALLSHGVAIAGLKLGDQGIYLRTTEDPKRLERCSGLALSPRWLRRELFAPAYYVEVVGTTGAGDCAVAGFIAALLRGLSPEESLTFATAAGACNAEVADAVSGIPSLDALKERIDLGWLRRPYQLQLQGWFEEPTSGLWYGPTDHTTTAAQMQFL